MEEFITIALSDYANKLRKLHGIKRVGIFHVEKQSEKNKAFGAYTTYIIKVLFEDYETNQVVLICRAQVSTNMQFEQDKIHMKEMLKHEVYDNIISLIHNRPKDFEDIILGKPDRDKFSCKVRIENFK